MAFKIIDNNWIIQIISNYKIVNYYIINKIRHYVYYESKIGIEIFIII